MCILFTPDISSEFGSQFDSLPLTSLLSTTKSESDAIFARALDAAEGKYHRVHHDIGRIALTDGKLDIAEKELRAYLFSRLFLP